MAAERRSFSDVWLGAVLLMLLAIMIVPVPTFVLDSLLVLSVAVSLVIVLSTVYVAEPLKLNAFPTVLLLVTLFRLALNVATTRTILLEGYGGKVIGAFGNFVVGGNYAVGLVAFFILIIIQFVVITRGSGRIAEVAARFTLDAMPGRQMAIDADLNAGLIDEQEARERRTSVQRQADFYGAMDGASKFVRGDAIAAIIITAVNILGGFVIGVMQQGMGFGEALRTYTLLTIGDGLVAQIPALVVSTAAGILITRTEGQGRLASELGLQLFREPRAPMLASAILLLLGLVPGLPFLPFFGLAVATGFLGWRAQRHIESEEEAEEAAAKAKQSTVPEKVETLITVDPIELELGFGLIPLVDETREGGDLLKRVTLVRKQAASDLGLLVPPIRVRDNVRLPQDSYVIRLRGIEVARGKLRVDSELAMSPGPGAVPIEGVETKEPVFGLQAFWIRPEKRSEAEVAGYTVVEPSAVAATHLTETIKTYAAGILGRQEVQTMIDQVKKTAPVVVEELIPAQMTVGGVQKVLQRLLRERVSIRDLVTIFEALADHADQTKDLEMLVARAREALGRGITESYRDDRGELGIVALDPALEDELLEILRSEGEGQRLLVAPDRVREILEAASKAVHAALVQTSQPVILCSPVLRPHFRGLIERALPHIPVLSYAEVASAGTVRTLATVKLDHAHQAI